jgi:diacylglycerol kinase (ATP)
MRALILFNPAAGTAAEGPRVIAATKGLEGFEVRELEGPGSAKRIARAACDEGFDVVAAAGGDGTVHEVVEGLADAPRPARLGLIPLGTGNDLARTLGIPLDPLSALDVLRGGGEATIDLIRVASERERAWCVNVAAGGFSGQVDEVLTDELKASCGPLAYVRGALSVLPDLTGYETTIAYDDGSWERVEALNVIVANGRTCAGGVRVAPAADPSDGLLDVVVVRYGTLLDLAAVGAALLGGDYLDRPDVTLRRARRVRVASRPGMWFNVDGELLTKEPVTFSIVPGALRVVTPAPAEAA